MARPSHSRALGIWANGRRVGRWVVPATGPMELSYDPSWVASAEARPLSLSLPMNLDGVAIKGEKAGFFFDNVLPDSPAIRQRVRSRFHTRVPRVIDEVGAALPPGFPARVFDVITSAAADAAARLTASVRA